MESFIKKMSGMFAWLAFLMSGNVALGMDTLIPQGHYKIDTLFINLDAEHTDFGQQKVASVFEDLNQKNNDVLSGFKNIFLTQISTAFKISDDLGFRKMMVVPFIIFRCGEANGADRGTLSTVFKCLGNSKNSPELKLVDLNSIYHQEKVSKFMMDSLEALKKEGFKGILLFVPVRITDGGMKAFGADPAVTQSQD